jgi:tetratricopeptide (TPR) repeat protein
VKKKIPLSLRINILFKNYGKRAFYIPLLVVGISASLGFLSLCGSIAGLSGAVLGLFWGIIIARLAAPAIGDWFGNLFYAPKEYLKVTPDIMSPIKGLLAREEYDEALEKLNELLEAKPFCPEPYLLMVETYANDLGDYLRAMTLIEEYFAQEEVHTFEENIDMLLLYADICGEHNYLHKAEELLEQEVARKGYLEIKRKRLQTRLEAIKSKN